MRLRQGRCVRRALSLAVALTLAGDALAGCGTGNNDIAPSPVCRASTAHTVLAGGPGECAPPTAVSTSPAATPPTTPTSTAAPNAPTETEGACPYLDAQQAEDSEGSQVGRVTFLVAMTSTPLTRRAAGPRLSPRTASRRPSVGSRSSPPGPACADRPADLEKRGVPAPSTWVVRSPVARTVPRVQVDRLAADDVGLGSAPTASKVRMPVRASIARRRSCRRSGGIAAYPARPTAAKM